MAMDDEVGKQESALPAGSLTSAKPA